jgi:hypothetical protein
VATALAGPVARRGPALRSVYDFVPDGLIRGVFFRALLLAAPIQSVLLTSVQGTTPAFILALFSPFLLVAKDRRYGRLLAFLAGFVLLYALYMALSLSGYLIDEPDMSRLTVIREAFVYGQLRQTHLTQGVYLLTSLLFAFLVYAYWQEAFLKFIYFAILLLATYGFFEFMFFAVFHTNGDFLSNRNFGDLDTAAAGAGRNLSVTGSRLQTSNLFGEGYMRLKSLTAEPSMYSLSVTPFTVYAFGRRWWWIFTVLMTSLVLSTSSTAVIGLLAGLGWIETRRRPEAVLYLTGAVVTVALLYATAEPVQRVLDVLLFEKLDTVSGNERINYFTAHAVVPFDGNPIRALFGLGFGTVRSGDMLSNLLANVGLVGLMGYATLLLAPCFLLRKSQDRLSIVASLLAIFAMEMLTVPEFNYLPPWFMVAMAYARVREQRRAGGAPAA